MVSYRLITFLFILSNAGVVSSKSTAIDNQEQVPCSNDENTSAAITTFTPPSPTTKRPTTTGVDPKLNVQAYWVNVSLNKTNGQYYWSDGHSIPTIDPQPTVTDPNGKGVWVINRDSSVPGFGSVSIIPETGEATQKARAVLCGGPG
ncbi:unnamed protein product [Caenorhabditis brenneri]